MIASDGDKSTSAAAGRVGAEGEVDANALTFDRRTMLRGTLASLLALASGGVTAGFTGLLTAGCADDAPPRDSFAFLSKTDVITLDLNQMSYTQDFRVTYLMREGLFVYDAATGDPIPALAKSHTISDDKKVWTFQIRDDAKWSNGDPVLAKDFAFSWRLMLTSPSEYGYLFYYVKNARAYEKSYLDKTPLADDQLGIKVIDDRTLEVTLENPLPFLPDLLGFPPFYPRHEASMAPFRQADGSYDGRYTRPENVVLNGSYVFSSWDEGKRLVFTKNDKYWGAPTVKSKTVEMVVNADGQSGLIQYKRGRVDWFIDVPADMAFKLKQSGNPDLRVNPAYGTGFVTFNVLEHPQVANVPQNPLRLEKVRQAMSMAIDRKYIVDKVTRMGERQAYSYVPPGYFDGYVSTMTPGFNPDGARKLLAEAGFGQGTRFPTLSISYNSDSTIRKALAEYLKQTWNDVLGVPIDLDPLELKVYRNTVKDKRYTIALVSWYGDYLDLTTWTDKYLSMSLQNDTGWGPREYDQLCDAATREPDSAKRLALLQRAEAMINTQLPIVPLYHYVTYTMHSDAVHGLIPNKKDVYQLKYVWVDRGGGKPNASTQPTTVTA